MKYSTRYVHKIATRAYCPGPDIELEPEQLENRITLGKALRQNRMLCRGERLAQVRCEKAQVVAFPSNTIWWSIILIPQELQG